MSETTTQIISIDEFNLGELFIPSKPELAEKMLAKIEKEAFLEVCDCSTEEGRKREYTIARQISSIKTLVDDHGKGIVSDAKAKIREVDGRRKLIRDKCDELRDKRLAGRKEWEEKEAARQQKHRDAIEEIKGLRNQAYPAQDAREEKQCVLEQYEGRVDMLSDIKVDVSFEEFEDEAKAEFKRTAEFLEHSIVSLKADIERDKRLAELEAKEQARIEEEKAEQLRLEGEERARKKQAEEQARNDAEPEKRKGWMIPGRGFVDFAEPVTFDQAVETLNKVQAKLIGDPYASSPDEPATTPEEYPDLPVINKNDAMREHMKKINNAAKDAFVQHVGITEEDAKAVVTAIYKGLVPNITIQY
jgi:hypothetical protein